MFNSNMIKQLRYIGQDQLLHVVQNTLRNTQEGAAGWLDGAQAFVGFDEQLLLSSVSQHMYKRTKKY